jgi:hypothetical protein
MNQPQPQSASARIAPAQRAARESPGTLRRHAACSPAARLHTTARSAQCVGVSPSGGTNSNPQNAPQSMSPRILPRMFGAMRDMSRTTLILRLPATCHVAAQGLPASARLCASGRIGPGCALRAPATVHHRC